MVESVFFLKNLFMFQKFTAPRSTEDLDITIHLADLNSLWGIMYFQFITKKVVLNDKLRTIKSYFSWTTILWKYVSATFLNRLD